MMMATAVKTATEVKREIKTVVTEVVYGVQLNLSDKQAKALSALIYRVGGSPDKTARGSIAEISNALVEIGYYGNYNTEVQPGAARIYFENDVS
jgi:hypothetical protein